MFTFSYVTTEGQVRKINQDALLIKTARYKGEEILFAAVCDGIGGLTEGETASAFVISGLSEWFSKKYPEHLKKNEGVLEIRQSLDQCLRGLNDDLNAVGQKGRLMGTTMTAFLIDPRLDIMLAAHAGDTRLYKIYDGRSEIVTSDHSVVAEAVRWEGLSKEEAAGDVRQNQITNCIGAGETDRSYDYIIQAPEKNCVYMLCSDGFRKMISQEEIEKHLSPGKDPDARTLKRSLEELLRLDLDRGETDNITALAAIYTLENQQL